MWMRKIKEIPLQSFHFPTKILLGIILQKNYDLMTGILICVSNDIFKNYVKGLTMFGRSRSTKEDFCEAVTLMEEDVKLVKRLSLLISKEMTVQCINDVEKAFEVAQIVDYKVVMKWNV